MTETEKIAHAKSGIGTFAVKALIVVAAIVVLANVVFGMIDSRIKTAAESFKGGRQFWADAEWKLLKLADEPDVDPVQKAKIIMALKKISEKYKPYMDALNGQ